jgi:hypothetical protein
LCVLVGDDGAFEVLTRRDVTVDMRRSSIMRESGPVLALSNVGKVQTRGPAWRGRAGIVPVKVAMVTSGKQFKFERLLVVGQTLRVSTEVRHGMG